MAIDHAAVISDCSPTDCTAAPTASYEISSVKSSSSASASNAILDKKSASVFSLPGRYLIVKLKLANSATHLLPVAFNLAVDRTYFNGLLSL